MSEKTPSKVVGKDPKYRESSSKRTIIECRFYDKSMKEQNYATHLKFIHSKEDWKDLRDKSNKSIQDMFAIQTSTIKRPAPPQDTNVDISVKNLLIKNSCVFRKAPANFAMGCRS